MWVGWSGCENITCGLLGSFALCLLVPRLERMREHYLWVVGVFCFVFASSESEVEVFMFFKVWHSEDIIKYQK